MAHSLGEAEVSGAAALATNQAMGSGTVAMGSGTVATERGTSDSHRA
ncbi:MAG: hypothetical protein LBR33_00885 [Propionibacteriaceae bacterium]|nr:hypothetical protein [Propionibacteriaceae bacterium]